MASYREVRVCKTASFSYASNISMHPFSCKVVVVLLMVIFVQIQIISYLRFIHYYHLIIA